ncbi:hypothetical protein TBLA_0I02070 [Henningerozyma blattae CBS 6284]|uniref:DBF4-type domain-containing protein n=1 Tax=Henningerozyma blattae (strain ATCC 34711 / CBS 6284 / DSM 70876 / NBRC 10599 / NRRL Y-10934 / UCD 77-7) TaxID=1071380 RepID=I2H913_HENB6|nr:hypothetical protein TBLA_0I02070 [Tetrapisispora blattae CBS 6284]CCH62865.1 hypothetical protein TBLA_0I02070 [Tetrapisispora blattae CBS 6284]
MLKSHLPIQAINDRKQKRKINNKDGNSNDNNKHQNISKNKSNNKLIGKNVDEVSHGTPDQSNNVVEEEAEVKKQNDNNNNNRNNKNNNRNNSKGNHIRKLAKWRSTWNDYFINNNLNILLLYSKDNRRDPQMFHLISWILKTFKKYLYTTIITRTDLRSQSDDLLDIVIHVNPISDEIVKSQPSKTKFWSISKTKNFLNNLGYAYTQPTVPLVQPPTIRQRSIPPLIPLQSPYIHLYFENHKYLPIVIKDKLDDLHQIFYENNSNGSCPFKHIKKELNFEKIYSKHSNLSKFALYLRQRYYPFKNVNHSSHFPFISHYNFGSLNSKVIFNSLHPQLENDNDQTIQSIDLIPNSQNYKVIELNHLYLPKRKRISNTNFHSGYCEICKSEFKNYTLHKTSDEHLKHIQVLESSDSFELIDNLIETLQYPF